MNKSQISESKIDIRTSKICCYCDATIYNCEKCGDELSNSVFCKNCGEYHYCQSCVAKINMD